MKLLHTLLLSSVLVITGCATTSSVDPMYPNGPLKPLGQGRIGNSEVASLEATGDLPHGGLAGNKMGQCGLIVLGQIATSCFDASCDWTDVLHPNLGPDGILTVGGNGELLHNVVVQNAPSAEQEFLVLKVKSV